MTKNTRFSRIAVMLMTIQDRRLRKQLVASDQQAIYGPPMLPSVSRLQTRTRPIRTVIMADRI